MLSALLMLKRLRSALSYARREEYWDRVAGAGVLLVAIGTLTYTLNQDWHVVDSVYFATAILMVPSRAARAACVPARPPPSAEPGMPSIVPNLPQRPCRMWPPAAARRWKARPLPRPPRSRRP